MASMIEQPPRTIVRDPVCGMEMQRSDAIAMRQVNGITYYFCSHDCAVAFDADPARYVAPASATTGVPAGGARPAQIALPIADLKRSGAAALERFAITLQRPVRVAIHASRMIRAENA